MQMLKTLNKYEHMIQTIKATVSLTLIASSEQ